jgi:hypothetical protein
MTGNSRLPDLPLEPNLTSFITSIPKALNHIFLRPYFTEIKDMMYLITCVETYCLTALILFCLLKINRKESNHVALQFSFIVCATMFVIIAYIVPFQGALIRYRSEYFPLLFSAFACALPSMRLLETINTRICALLR